MANRNFQGRTDIKPAKKERKQTVQSVNFLNGSADEEKQQLLIFNVVKKYTHNPKYIISHSNVLTSENTTSRALQHPQNIRSAGFANWLSYSKW